MDVAITTLRAELSTWIDHARGGEEIVITERGLPVARLLGIDTAPLLDRLVEEGVLGRPATTTRPSARDTKPVKAQAAVSDLVGEHRR